MPISEHFRIKYYLLRKNKELNFLILFQVEQYPKNGENRVRDNVHTLNRNFLFDRYLLTHLALDNKLKMHIYIHTQQRFSIRRNYFKITYQRIIFVGMNNTTSRCYDWNGRCCRYRIICNCRWVICRFYKQKQKSVWLKTYVNVGLSVVP